MSLSHMELKFCYFVENTINVKLLSILEFLHIIQSNMLIVVSGAHVMNSFIHRVEPIELFGYRTKDE